MHERLKKIIFKKLDQDLGRAEIIVDDNNSIWFIDRANKHWYLELRSEGVLWWRYSFFNDFFKVFSMESIQFEPIISEWVEDVLNHKVSTTSFLVMRHLLQVEDVLNHKVSTTIPVNLGMGQRVKYVLNRKVETTKSFGAPKHFQVDKVLNHKVSKTLSDTTTKWDLVEDVLNENPTE